MVKLLKRFFLIIIILFLLAALPMLIFAQDCSSYATLTVTAEKSAYLVGEPFNGEIVFINNIVPANIDFAVTATKDGQLVLSKSYTLPTQVGRNAYALKDALGTDVLPEPGIYVISVTASHQDTGCSWTASLTLNGVAKPTPQISSLQPNAGLPGIQVTISGSGFTPSGNNIQSGSTIIVSNLPSPDGRTLTFTLPNAPPGTYPISVSNANGISNEVSFAVLAPSPPQIQSLNPSSALPGASVTIIGSGFTSTGNTVYSGAVVVAQDVPSPDGRTLAFTVPNAPAGSYPISVSNQNGLSNEVAFTVLPVRVLSSLTISPQQYLLGQTATGSLNLNNPTSKTIPASFSIELYKDNTLVWSRQLDADVAPGSSTFSLENLFGFKPTIPEDAFFVGNWRLVINRLNINFDDSVAQTFSIVSPVVQPSIVIEPREYNLGETIQGRVTITNNNNIPVNARFKIELFQNNVLKWQREISMTVPPGTQPFTLKDIFGVTPVIPNDRALIGNWKLKITQIGVINPVPAEAEFIIRVIEVRIESIAPSSAAAGTQVTITGTGFTSTGNNIMSGSTIVSGKLPSTGARELIFTLPNVAGGNYPLKVSNQNGVSNEVGFTVLPLKLLSSLAISPQEYLLGQTITGSLTMNNPTDKNIQASLSIEIYKDSVLVLQRQADYNTVPGINRISLDNLFGFTPIIPEDTFFVGQYRLIVRRVNIDFDDSVAQTFSIKAPVLQLTFNFDSTEYFLGDTLKGKGTIVNPSNIPVSASLKIELFQGSAGSAPKWQREIKDVSIPPGTSNFIVDDLFGSKVVIPNEPSLIGDWKLKISQMGTTPPVSVEAGFKIQSLTAACKPTTGTPESGVFGLGAYPVPWRADTRFADALGELGVKWIRLDFTWNSIQPNNRGSFDWSSSDVIVRALKERNIQVLAILSSTPGWANGNQDIWVPPSDYNDYANFVREVVKRYRPGGDFAKQNGWGDSYGISYWEIWNEPDIDGFWKPKPNPGDYTRLLALSNKVIREVDPNAIILNGGLAISGASEFLKGIYANDGKNCFDVLAQHPYGVDPRDPQGFSNIVNAAKKILADNGDANKPIWFNEYGFATGPGSITEEQHAEALRLTFAQKGVVPTFFWFSLGDMDPGGGAGLLRYDFSKKPAFDVLKNLLNPPSTAACKPTTGTPESGIFGIIKGWFPWEAEPRHLDAVKELGVKWTRLEIRWDQIERQKGQFDWSFYDLVLRNFDENNIKVLGQLSGVPCWANGRACQQPGIDEHYPPNDLNDWANFVRRAVNRYKPGGEITLKNPVIHWEVWNEPNIGVFWRPQPDARAYTNLLAVSNKAIREVDPKAIIGTAGFAGIPQDFVDELYNQGAKNCFDTINFHPYGPVEQLQPITEAIKSYLAEHNDTNKPIWYTEYGFVTGISGEPGPVGPKVSEQEQAQYVKETYDLFKQGIINNLFWISLIDGEEGLAGGDFGLLRRDFSKKPAFDVLKNLLNPPPAGPVYFQFDEPSLPETFIFKLTDAAKIAEARRILAGQNGRKIHTMGTIVKSPEPYNPPWSYHLNPDTITFFESAIEVCDASIRYVEEHLGEWPVLPNNLWCPWSSRLLREVTSPSPGISINVDAAKTGRNIAKLKKGYNYLGPNSLIPDYPLKVYEREIGHGGSLLRVHNSIQFALDNKQFMKDLLESIRKTGTPDVMFNIIGIPKHLSSYDPKRDVFGCALGWSTYPPKDYNLWKKHVKEWVEFLKPYHNSIKYWEIWNEPENSENNLPGCFWSGTEQEFFNLYKATVEGIKEGYGGSIPAGVKIGGPALAYYANKIRGGQDPLYISLPRFAKQNNLPLDFFSWHNYNEFLSEFKDFSVSKVRAEVIKYFPNAELIIDEWDLARRDNRYTALLGADFGFMARQGLDRQSMFMITDDDPSAPETLFKYSGMFGIVENLITKPTFNLFKAINGMGNIIVSVDSQPSTMADYVLATKSSEKVSVMIVNFQDTKVSIPLTIKNVPQTFTKYTKYIIDATHSNAWAVEARIKTRMDEGKLQALPQTKETFKSVLRQKGYPESFITTALNMLELYLRDNNDQTVKDWLNSLTPQQKQDVLDAFSQAMNNYNAAIEIVADEINNWPEVRLYSETKTIAIAPGGTYSETVALEPYAVQFIELSSSVPPTSASTFSRNFHKR